MLSLTQKGLDVLRQLEDLSESDIRLIGFIASEKVSVEKSVEGLEYIGTKRGQVNRLQGLGYIKGE